MFTGIIETVGTITHIEQQGTNHTFWISSELSDTLKIDQSVSHNGICLTVEAVNGSSHRVTAIEETIRKTNVGHWKVGDLINIERCLPMHGRLDGHIVQGHVDSTAICTRMKTLEGSWEFTFQFPTAFAALVIEKGSIAINGISLTAFNVTFNELTVAIIPYTFEHTNLQRVQEGSIVNIEFDMLGKYLQRHIEVQQLMKGA
ncbi:MAG TPA: riboflavin synthase [Chitinophagaceae bacterium]|nr:riboflavin synthase [Chitinophagaceae bacterium]HAN38179.1 riboflavin synthase [Chitinophagaceae bacterium]